MKAVITNHEQINLPRFKCPKCDGFLTLEEVDDWVEDDNGEWQVNCISLGCTNDKDFDDPDYSEWFDWHYGNMPYVYWLPVTEQVKAWINQHYKWDFSADVEEEE